MDTYAYILEDNMYINLTNLCTNDCIFCIRSLNDAVAGSNLYLTSEKINIDDVLAQIKEKMTDGIKEVVFCGYGEPTLKLDLLKQVAEFIKKEYPNLPTRINTNGQANVVFKRNVVPELKGLIDKVSISLNSDNAAQYQELSQSKFGESVYEEVKTFAKLCQESEIDTSLSIVTGYKGNVINVENCQKIAEDLGVKLRIREWLDEGYN
jgi:TatD family-associated radical SAM protein